MFEKSCGAVVFTKSEDEIKFVLVENFNGVYGFPKGHVEVGETEKETALREVFEETDLKINLIDGFRVTNEYLISEKNNTVKKVIYFLGHFDNQTIKCKEDELKGTYLVSYEKAMDLLKYERLKQILDEAVKFLRECDC